jgi:hypothetical protein
VAALLVILVILLLQGPWVQYAMTNEATRAFS